MAPALLMDAPQAAPTPIEVKKVQDTPKVPQLSIHRPLQLGDSLKEYKYLDISRYIGREYVDVQVRDLLNDPDSDKKLRDLAITSKFLLFSSPLSLFTIWCYQKSYFLA